MEKGKTDRSSSATLRSARGKGEEAKRAFDEEGGRKRRKERDEMAEAIEAHTGDSRLFDRACAPLVRPTVDAWHDFF